MAQTQNQTGTLAAYFDNAEDARQAVEALKEAGFLSAHIGVAHRGQSVNRSSQPSSYTTTSTRSDDTEHSGSTWDKIKSWFTGDEPEPYADERTRGDLATREITDPEAGTSYGRGYGSSDLQGSFRNLDIPDEQSRYFTHRLGKSGNGAVVTVNAATRRAEAEEILTRYGGDLAGNATTYDYGETGAETARATSGETRRDESTNDIQLLGEVLRVHKDRVNRGEVRVRKEVVTENQSVQVPVTREELVIERRPGNEAAAPAGSIGEQEIRVPLSEERATVDKATVVREEVSVAKKPVEEVQDVSGEVRHEELKVDDPTRKIA